MSTRPLVLNEVVQNRRQKILEIYQEAMKVVCNAAGSLSDPGGQTTTVNLPLPPKVFTIVSWNVQTFFSGKSLSNPLVNKILNRVLQDLDADVCMLLETREESYLNMNAIETNHIGNKKWKMTVGEDDEENDEDDPLDYDEVDDGTDDDDDDPLTTDQMTYGGEPLTYLQLVSEMTGKKWRPPERVYVYNKDVSDRFRQVADVVLDDRWTKKSKLSTYEKKQHAAVKKRIEKDPAFYQKLAKSNLSKKEVAAALTYIRYPKLYKKFCVNDTGQPINAWTMLLSEDPLKSYYRFVYLDQNCDEFDFTGGNVAARIFVIVLNDCPACGKPLGQAGCSKCAIFGPGGPAFVNLRQVIDEITFYRCNCEESYSALYRPDADITSSSSTGVWLKDKLVSLKAVASRLLLRGPDQLDPKTIQVVTGDLLKFSDEKCAFRGRSPYLMPMEIWLPYTGQGVMLEMVAFHGPFGADTTEGIKLRSLAMKELLEGASGDTQKALKDCDNAMVIGDFNLDWDPSNQSANKGGIASELYGYFHTLGFEPMIKDGVATSLKPVTGNAKWKSVSPSTTNYTSSAYDNIFLKTPCLKPFVANACVVDVLDWISTHLSEFPIPDDDKQKDAVGLMAPIAQAMYIYRKYVSDHLPVLIDILVAPMSDGARNVAIRKKKAAAEAVVKSGRVKQFDVIFVYDQLLEIDRTDQQVDDYKTEGDEPARKGLFCGTVESVQDNYLIISCRPLQVEQGQVIWLSWALPPENTRLNKLLLTAFSVGTRVRMSVLNPAFLK